MIIQLLLNVNTRKQERRRFQKSSFSFSENKSKEFRMRITLGMRNFSKMLDTRTLNLLETYSGFNPSALNIQKFLDFGRTASEEDSFKFLREEIPVRLSNIMKEINLLPGNLLHMPSVFTLQVNDAFELLWPVCQFNALHVEFVTPSMFSRTGIHRASET